MIALQTVFTLWLYLSLSFSIASNNNVIAVCIGTLMSEGPRILLPIYLINSLLLAFIDKGSISLSIICGIILIHVFPSYDVEERVIIMLICAVSIGMSYIL